jgi:hypothetical protein
MSTLALLVLLAACILATFAALASFGWRAWGLIKASLKAVRGSGTIAADAAGKAALATTKAGTLAENAERLTGTLADLQTSLARVTVLGRTLAEAEAPWKKLTRLKK